MKKQLTLMPLVGLIYFTVSGGAFGLEDLVASCGPGLAMLLLIVTPLLWSVPTALVTAELGAMLPLEGGYYRWVYFGLGRQWGFMEGWWTWLYTFVDMAIYPVLFTAYLKAFLGFFFPGMGEWPWWVRWLICLCVIGSSLLINLTGAKSVGRSAVIAFGVVTLPFLILAALGLPLMSHSPVQPFAAGDGPGLMATMGTGLTAVMWSYMGWDNVSTYAGEVDNPGRNFPLAMLIAVALVTLLYLVPIGVTLSLTTNWAEWHSENFTIADVAGKAIGRWLGILLSFAVMWSLWSMFNSQLLYTSRLPFTMAEDGLLPHFITKSHPRWDSPYVSLILCSVIYSVFSLLSFQKLVVINVVIYSTALTLEYVALVLLRWRRPDLHRPFRIPGGWFGVILAFASMLAFAITAVIFTITGADESWKQLVIVAVLLASGPLIYYARTALRPEPDPIVPWVRALTPGLSPAGD
ncbi:MAG: APC family permease [Blastocatellia bacterium]